jgi:hypothetical protein
VINGIWFLFILGVMCGYFLILPFAVNFGVIFKISDIIVPLYDLSDYTTLFLQVVLGMGVFSFPNGGLFINEYWNSYSTIFKNLQKTRNCSHYGSCSNYYTSRCSQYDGSSYATRYFIRNEHLDEYLCIQKIEKQEKALAKAINSIKFYQMKKILVR